MEVSRPGQFGATRAEILLVEDHPGDVRLAREALRDAKIDNDLLVLTDGAEALSFLRREGSYAEAVRPDLVLLDLNLPRRSGCEVLEEMRRDPGLASIPVVVVTASETDLEACRSLDLGRVDYMTKPIDFRQLARIVRSVSDLWFSIVMIEPGNPPEHEPILCP
jgi:two-component system, chemotaxis family, response regulator Rcp1